MKEFTTRAIFGAIYAAVILAGIYFHAYGLLAILVLIFVVGVNEMKHLLKAHAHQNLYTSATLLGVFVLWAHLLFTSENQNHLVPFLVFMLMVLVVQHLFLKGSETNSDRLPKVIFTTIYLFLPTSLAISIAYLNGEWEPKFLFGLFLLLWANDTFAYLAGIAIGKHKLIPRLSPKKSVEGLIGGILGALLVGYLLSIFWDVLTMPQWMIFAAIVAVSGTIGDLFESSLKRTANVKDSGNLIPGHGGILDRLDSFLIAVPFVYFYLYFFT